MRRPTGLILLAAVILLVTGPVKAVFREQLQVLPLSHHGHVALVFGFTIDWDSDELEGRHFNICPKALCSLIASHRINQLDLVMTKGRWNYEKWGNSPLPAPQGAELTVFYESGVNASTIDPLWRATTSGLAGQFCASLEYMYRPVVELDKLFDTHPIGPFKIEAQTSTEEANVRLFKESEIPPASSRRLMRHSVLHGETVCTENLTPWMKLLPCRAEAGLARYLSNPSSFFNFDYTSLGVHLRPSSSPKTQPPSLELTLLVVVDTKLPPANAGISTFQPPTNADVFQLSRFLGVNHAQTAACPLATTSTLRVRNTTKSDAKPIQLASNCPKFVESRDGSSDCDLLALDGKSLDLSLTWPQSRASIKQEFEGFVTAHRWLVGWGQQNGKLALAIENKLNHTVSIRYRQTTPFMLRFKFHTMHAMLSYLDGDLDQEPSSRAREIIPDHFTAMPGQDRRSPTTMDLHLTLPARSSVMVTVEYDLVFLHWTEHPPDAHRGFDVSAGILLVSVAPAAIDSMLRTESLGVLAPISAASRDGLHHFVIYTEGLVLSLPTPDFSMPYNVITLTSTVVAIFFAFTVKSLTRRHSLLYQDGQFKSDRFIVVILRTLREKLCNRRR